MVWRRARQANCLVERVGGDSAWFSICPTYDVTSFRRLNEENFGFPTHYVELTHGSLFMQRPDQRPKLIVMFRSCAMLACLPLLITARTPTPRFEDYSVREVFHGAPTAPDLSAPWARLYRTRIRNAALNNDGFFRGSKYVQASGPNFAGHYRVANWGCGAGCLIMVIIDLETRQVHPPPLSAGKTEKIRLLFRTSATDGGISTFD